PPGSVLPQPAAMEASPSLWHSYLGVILSRERQRMEHFQRAEDILLTLLESVHARDPRFLVDYARNLEAFEFSVCASEDAVTLEVPLRIDGDTLRVLARRSSPEHPAELSTCCLELCSPRAGLEDWTGAVDGMEHCLLPGKILQHLKELLVSAIVRCQRLFLLQPGDISAENLREDALELSLLIRGSWKPVRFNIVPVVRRQQEPLQLRGRRSGRGFPAGSLSRATEEAHFVPASPLGWSDPAPGMAPGTAFLGSGLVPDPVLLSPSPQMVLLWSTELFPSPEDWQDLEGSVYRLLVILLRCLATRHLPHFLNPEENLFQGAAPDLASLYHKVESFAWDPQRFLRFHFGLHGFSGSCQADRETRALLQLPTRDGSCWDTAYFDILLSQFQVFRIQDSARRSAASQLLARIRQEIPQQS
uniref:Mab-21 like 4 n=1 Tax=Zonotrichia albicollis TaxID=44394 RepID=A0A8D2M847_ZONAL